VHTCGDARMPGASLGGTTQEPPAWAGGLGGPPKAASASGRFARERPRGHPGRTHHACHHACRAPTVWPPVWEPRWGEARENNAPLPANEFQGFACWGVCGAPWVLRAPRVRPGNTRRRIDRGQRVRSRLDAAERLYTGAPLAKPRTPPTGQSRDPRRLLNPARAAHTRNTHTGTNSTLATVGRRFQSAGSQVPARRPPGAVGTVHAQHQTTTVVAEAARACRNFPSPSNPI
jgi:hypothetical protein